MNGAKRTFIAVMGAWMGLAGVEHGIGEILQGNVAPDGIMIQSWPGSAFFQSLGGEPAMTILPNLLLTGILAVAFSLLFSIGAIFFALHRPQGLALIPLAVLMLLFGGGIFPPVLGLLIATSAAVSSSQRETKPITGIRRVIGKGWRWIFPACCMAWLLLFPGVAVLSYSLPEVEAGVIFSIMILAFVMLFLSGWSSILYDRLPLSGIETGGSCSGTALDQSGSYLQELNHGNGASTND